MESGLIPVSIPQSLQMELTTSRFIGTLQNQKRRTRNTERGTRKEDHETRNAGRIFPIQLKTVPLQPKYLHPQAGFEKTRTESK